ncbi:NADPH-dependent FMN reductase [Demequina subtropica]|uniref:NADPH-dependent FMN reductase n=1 Tax=Demequina subtropica TaxID=1638989 RepID=UPI000784170E|nr:NADPH-dependent FMN reductase [Demequina subtropica]
MPTIGLLLGQLPQARSTRLLSSLLHRAAPRGTTLVELTPQALPMHPPYTDAPMPSSGAAWKCALAGVDGLIVVTPSHERSIPGTLKHALDWAASSPSPLAGMPVMIAGVARPGEGLFSPVTHLRTVLMDAGAEVAGQPERSLAMDPAAFGEAGECSDAALWQQAAELVADAAGFTVHVRRARAAVPSTPVPAIDAAGPAPRSPEVGVPLATQAMAAVADPAPLG